MSENHNDGRVQQLHALQGHRGAGLRAVPVVPEEFGCRQGLVQRLGEEGLIQAACRRVDRAAGLAIGRRPAMGAVFV